MYHDELDREARLMVQGWRYLLADAAALLRRLAELRAGTWYPG